MKTLDITVYPNLLDHLRLTSSEISSIIATYPLSFPQIRNEQAEWTITFPMFVTPFYNYVCNNNTLLTQNHFHEYYISENKVFFTNNNFDTPILEGLKARVYRTYPSLVRDLHFNLFVSETLKDSQIIYNINLDIEEGIDILINLNTTLYAINLFTDTPRAHNSREKKTSRHTPFDNVHYIDLPVSFKGSLKCGDFFLYGEQEYTQLIKLLNI